MRFEVSLRNTHDIVRLIHCLGFSMFIIFLRVYAHWPISLYLVQWIRYQHGHDRHSMHLSLTLSLHCVDGAVITHKKEHNHNVNHSNRLSVYGRHRSGNVSQAVNSQLEYENGHSFRVCVRVFHSHSLISSPSLSWQKSIYPPILDYTWQHCSVFP